MFAIGNPSQGKKTMKECRSKHMQEKQGVCAFPHCALEIETPDNKLKGTYSLKFEKWHAWYGSLDWMRTNTTNV